MRLYFIYYMHDALFIYTPCFKLVRRRDIRRLVEPDIFDAFLIIPVSE